MNELKPPIMILGNVRSGTTMLLDFFGFFDDMVTWFEPRTIWRMCHTQCPHDEFPAEWATPDVVSTLRAEFLKYQTNNGGRRVVEKTPANSVRVPFIREVFPEAKIVHIVRGGLDSVSSTLPKWQIPIYAHKVASRLKETPVWQWPLYLPRFLRDQIGIRLGLVDHVQQWGVIYEQLQDDLKNMELVEVIAKQWAYAVDTAQAELNKLDPNVWIETKYEDLVTRPEEELTRILDFLELKAPPALTRHLREDVYQDVINVYKKRLTPEQIEKTIPIVRPTMERLGYEIEEVPSA